MFNTLSLSYYIQNLSVPKIRNAFYEGNFEFSIRLLTNVIYRFVHPLRAIKAWRTLPVSTFNKTLWKKKFYRNLRICKLKVRTFDRDKYCLCAIFHSRNTTRHTLPVILLSDIYFIWKQLYQRIYVRFKLGV